jgi:hypothetical protein
MRTAVSLIFFTGYLGTGCNTLPPERHHSVDQLRELINESPPQCVLDQCTVSQERSIRCWPVAARASEAGYGSVAEPEKCVEKYRQWQDRVARRRAALDRLLHSMEVTAAPECIREMHVPSTVFDELGIDPRGKDAKESVAEVLLQGYVISTDSDCRAQLCAWPRRFRPGEQNPYCVGMSANLK